MFINIIMPDYFFHTNKYFLIALALLQLSTSFLTNPVFSVPNNFAIKSSDYLESVTTGTQLIIFHPSARRPLHFRRFIRAEYRVTDNLI